MSENFSNLTSFEDISQKLVHNTTILETRRDETRRKKEKKIHDSIRGKLSEFTT